MMYVTSRMSSTLTRRPEEVARLADTAWKYLVHTINDRIQFKTGGDLEISVYTELWPEFATIA